MSDHDIAHSNGHAIGLQFAALTLQGDVDTDALARGRLEAALDVLDRHDDHEQALAAETVRGVVDGLLAGFREVVEDGTPDGALKRIRRLLLDAQANNPT